jgi:hypothetical protein
VLERLLRIASIVCTLLVVAGWAWFAVDETRAASQHTQEEIAGQRAASVADPDPSQELAREKIHNKVHETVDDGNDLLLRPFAPLTQSSSDKWVQRSVPALMALLVYGFGFGMLSRALAGR